MKGFPPPKELVQWVLRTCVVLTALWPVPSRTWAAGDVPKCPWNQYYDENVNGCGPCSEICNNMKLTSTQEQCKAQCSRYLVYTNCQSEEYFDEELTACLPCSALCRQTEDNSTSQECHSKCRKFLEQNQPDKGQSGSQNVDISSDSSYSFWFPGLIAFVVIGLTAVTAIGGFVLHRRLHGPFRQTTQTGGTARDHVIGMEDQQAAVPVQVSEEDINARDISLQQTSEAQYGMAETDPLAPSSVAALRVQCMSY